MKNRKVIVTAFLLVAVMLLGVGFAQLNDSLAILGDSTVSGANAQNTYDQQVHFDKVALDADVLNWQDKIEDPAAISAWINEGTGADIRDSAGFAISTLKAKGDTAVIWFKVHNEGTNVATVSAVARTGENTDATLFGIEVELCDQNKQITTELPAGGELWVKVTVSLLKDPPSGDSKGNFTVNISALAD